MKKIQARLILLALAMITGLVLFTHSSRAAATITVNTQSDTTANDGECSLREAIIAANDDTASGLAPGECVAGLGADTIEFNIGPLDGGVKTIAPTSGLPDITSQITINGYTQDPTVSEPNSAVAPAPFNGTLLIQLSGTSLPGSPEAGGLKFQDGSDNSIVRGLVINRFTAAGIVINPGADGIQIKGNYIGTNTTGMTDEGNVGSGVTSIGTQGTSDGPDNAVIGGLLAADRNIISANSSHSNDPNMVIGSQGIAIIHGSNDWTVQGNYIGVAADGLADLGNELGGMTIDYIDGLLIGGDQPGATNVISGNDDGGLQPDGVNNLVVQGNYIGTDYTGLAALPNGTKGMTLAYGTTNALIGGTTPGSGNIIAFNPWFGINVWQAETQNVSIIGNSIHSNGQLGIDLSNQNDGAGLTINDALDSDVGANNYLNFPQYTAVSESAGNTTVEYRLDVPAGNYRIEYYSNTTADPSGNGEGETYLGFENITHPGGGARMFTHTLTGITGVTNLAMTTTQRDGSADGFGATSEFGGQIPVVTDLSLAKTLANPQDVAIGATLHYNVTLTNGGYSSVDLSTYDASSGLPNALFTDILPPDLTYVSNTNPDITCSDVGTAIPTLIAANHIEYSGIICGYSGSGQTLAAGESITETLNVTVNNTSDLIFTNYAFSGLPTEDPDTVLINNILFDAFSNNGSPDTIDALIVAAPNNFASATFPIPVEQQPPSETTTATGSLASTGLSVILVTIVGMVSTIVGSLVLRRNRSHSRV